MMKKAVLLTITIVLLLTMVLSGCGSTPTTEPMATPEESQAPEETQAPEESQAPEEPKVVYKESPYFEGKGLPPVAERLPEVPKISNEMDPSQLDYEIGQYGGMLRLISAVPEWNPDIFVMANEPLINTPGLLGNEVTPNVVENFEVSDDQKEFTFYMRKGLKWSDGEPVTAEDIRFTYEDVLMNEELTPAVPEKYRDGGKPDGQPMKLEIIDDYTFKISFNEPYGGFLLRIAIQGWISYTDLLKPKHYLQQFHKKYVNEEELEAKIAEAGFQPGEWWNLFNDKDITNWEMCQTKSVGFPNLQPWYLTKTSAEKFTFKRNPYYFKVDAEGNQLPYIDVLENILVPDTEVLNTKILAGEVDYTRESTALPKLPLYKENEERSGFKTVLLDTHGRPGDIFFNLTNEDPVWREVVRDVRFRQAISLGINRQEIIDSVYYGCAELPDKLNPSEYDVEKANKLLDEMGLDKKNDEGWRLGPDGKPFEIFFEVSSRVPETIPETELVVEFLKDLGLKTSMKTIDSALWGTRLNANGLFATVERTNHYWWDGIASYRANYFSPLWWSWYNSNGKTGEEPPADVLEFFENMRKISVASPKEALAAVEAIQNANKNNLYFICVVGNAKQPLIINKNLANVGHGGTTIAVNFAGEEYFLKK
ncbi:MAG: ABC transporter substrate-binding protein [Clostridia bacterium]|jgi:peptide/nickel transport system substrate-binding protein